MAAGQELGRLPRAAKAAVELDRGAAAQEAGYGVRLMKMLHADAGLKNDGEEAKKIDAPLINPYTPHSMP